MNNFQKLLSNKLNLTKVAAYMKLKEIARLKKLKRISSNKLHNHSQSQSYFHNRNISNLSNNSFTESNQEMSTAIPMHRLSTRERQELLALSECTFKPRILPASNHIYSFSRGRSEENIFEHLHRNTRLNSERCKKKMIHHMINESKECTFTPSQHKRSLSFSNFMTQTKNYELRKRLNLMSMILKRQQQEESKYTFTPSVSKSFDSSLPSIPRHVLLNREHFMKQERQRLRTLDYYQNVMAPHRNLRSRSSSTSSLTSSIPNYNANKLYEDARDYRFKKLDLAREYYKSLTFKPQINEREVQSTFEERNQKLVKLKKELQERGSKEAVKEERKSRKHLSKEEVEKNNKNVVERLYLKEMQKIREKQNLQRNENQEVSPIRITSKTEKTDKTSIKAHGSGKRDLLYKLRKEHSIKFKTEESAVKYTENTEENLKSEDLKLSKLSITDNKENENESQVNQDTNYLLYSKESNILVNQTHQSHQTDQTPSTSQNCNSTVTKTEDISTSSFLKRESKISASSGSKIDKIEESVRRRASNLIDKRLDELTRRRSSNKIEEKLFKPSYASASNLSNNANFRSKALMNIIKERNENH